MTISIDHGDYWIEYHRIQEIGVVAGASLVQTITLDRGGHFIGAGSFGEGSGGNGFIGGVEMITVVGGSLIYGTPITQIFVRLQNNDVVARTLTVAITVFMKK